MEDRGVEITDVMAVDDSFMAEVVGLAVARSPLHATACQKIGEALRVVVAATVGPLPHRLTAKLSSPDDERVIKEAAGLEVGKQRRDRLIDLRGVDGEILLDAVVGVPVLLLVPAAGVDLHEADAALDEPPGDEALAAERGGAEREWVSSFLLEEPVGGKRRRALVGEIQQLRAARLELEAEFVGGHPGFEIAGRGAGIGVDPVEGGEGVDAVSLHPPRHPGGRIEGRDRLAGRAEHRPLKGGRHVSSRPVSGAGDRPAARIEHDDEAGEIVVFAPQAVGEPASQRRMPLENPPGVHLQIR